MRGTLHIYQNLKGWKWKIYCNREQQDIVIRGQKFYSSKKAAKRGAITAANKFNVKIWGIDYS